MTSVSDQFARPHGLTGRLVGHVMARIGADMERATIAALELTGSERVLEVGFGPGVGIVALLERLPAANVAGADPSAEMVAQAAARVRRYGSGAVDLRQAAIPSLPWEDGTFDAVCTCNTVHHWPDPGEGLHELRRVLRPGGRVSIAAHGGSYRRTYAHLPDDQAVLAHLREALGGTGLALLRESIDSHGRPPGQIYLLAERPAH